MRTKTIVTFVFVASMLNSSTTAQQSHPSVTTTSATDYKVKIMTTLVIPANGKIIDLVRVLHALPTVSPWSNGTGGAGASEITWSSGGVPQYDKDHNSYQISWETSRRQQPGTNYTFVTQFVVRSADREFNPQRTKVAWRDYEKLPNRADLKIDPKLEVHPQLARVADQIKKEVPPAVAVQEFCKWISNTINYDASAPYATTDVVAILENRRGHCGHRANVMNQLCHRVGIPIHYVRGLDLNEPDGHGKLNAIASDYSNNHVWAEVYFPGVGWIEVDPGSGENPYRIPAKFVQNNVWIQNYSIWIQEDGKLKDAKSREESWKFETGKWISDYGVENVITYSIRKK